MWGSFLDKGKELAAQAKKAAEELDKHLNESVGVQQVTEVSERLDNNNDDALNDAWEEDDEIAVIADESSSPSALPEIKDAAANEQVREAANEEADVQEGGGWGGDEDVEFDEVEISELVKVPQAIEHVEAEAAVTEAPNEVPMAEEGEKAEDAPCLVEEETSKAEKAAVDSGSQVLADSAAEPAEPSLPEKSITDDTIREQGKEQETATPVESAPPFGSLFGSLAQLTHQPLSHTESEVVSKEETDEGEPAIEVEDDTPKQPEAEPEPEPENRPKELVVAEKSDVSDAESTPHKEQEESEPRVTVGATLESSAAPLKSSLSQSDEVSRFMEQQTDYTRIMEAKMQEMEQRLRQREEQLLSKTEQLTMMEAMHETEKQELVQKVQTTKEEAKRRIQKAKERVDSVEQRLKNVTASQSNNAEDAGKQAEIIAALRDEGEKLARKQAGMEAAVRAAKGEARELREQWEQTEEAKQKALAKTKSLEAELKSTKDDLSSARQGESQAGKLDSDLRQAREESEKRAATILSLEQELKELKAARKELRKELEETRKGAAVETEQERKKLLMEHNHLASDLETKLRTSEREAAVREDALRHEVDELRKRWQDAVRRADSLSVDVQSSTAPLLRQLESTNKQNRARAAAWAELETQLRAELEENVILNENLSKERGEWKTKCTRLERSTKEYENELKQLKGDLHDKTEKVQKLEHQLEEMKAEGTKMKAEWAEVERLANEGVSRVRSEMTRTVVDAEERHRAQIDSLDAQLRQERDQRTQLEQQVQGLLDNAGMFVPADSAFQPVQAVAKEATPKKLRQSQGQAEILAGALGGLGGGDDHSYGNDDDDDDDDGDDEHDAPSSGTGSFAALEQLSSRLKASKVELTTLRTRLAESERTREELVQVLAESRNAREKLPLFEARVQELTAENRELTLEVQGLREDISDVRELYRTQLNVLLEAQASHSRTNGNNSHASHEPQERPTGDKAPTPEGGSEVKQPDEINGDVDPENNI
jgi:hypothetical protein